MAEQPPSTPPGPTPPGDTPPGATSPGGTSPGGTPPGATPPGDTPPGPTMPGRTDPGAPFFDTIRRTELFRAQERWVGGVAGGVAYRLGIDPLIVRGVLVVLTVFGGLGLLLYGLAWALLPEQVDGRIHAQEMLRGHFDAGLAGAVVLVIIGLARPGLWWQGYWWGDAWATLGVLVSIAVALVVVWLVTHDRADRVPPPNTAASGIAEPGAGEPASAGWRPAAAGASTRGAAPTLPASSSSATTHPAPRPPRPVVPGPGRVVSFTVLGLALVGVAAVLLGSRTVWATTQTSWWLLGAGVVLTVLGLGILLSGVRGRRGGGLTGLSVLLIVVTLPLTLVLGVAPQVREALSLSPANLGDAYWAPTSPDGLASGYTHTAGRLEVDLGALPPNITDLDEQVPITLAAGQVILRVPADLDVDLHVQGTGAVRVEHPGAWYTDGRQVRTETNRTLVRQDVTMRSTTQTGPADLQVVVALGAGQVRLAEAPPIGIHPAEHSTQEG